jgi:hypothetical protein
MAAEAATGFLLWKWGWSLSGFHYSGMIVPEIVWSVSEKLERQNAAASEYKKASGGGAEIDDRPKSLLHRFAPSFWF